MRQGHGHDRGDGNRSRNKLTVPQLLLGMRAHPTYNEAVGEALEELEGGSIHTVPRQAPGKLKSRQ